MASVWSAGLLGVLSLFVATGAEAGTITVNLPGYPHGPLPAIGEEYVITVTVEADGTEVAGAFDSIFIEVGWNPSVLQVKNAGVTSTYGNATQTVVVGPNAGGHQMSGTGGTELLSGAPNPFCANDGFTCGIVTQTNASFDSTALDAQTLVGTLVLEVIDVGIGDLQITDSFDLSGQMDIVIVPEPGTATLLGLGLVALAHARRRREAPH